MYIKQKYQTLIPRIIAQFIDGVIFLLIANISDFFIPKTSSPAFLVSSVFQMLLAALYFVTGYVKFGCTLGKKIMGLRVLNLQENGYISFSMAFMRISVWLFLEAAPILFSVTGSNRETKLLEFSLNDFFDLVAGIWFLLNFAAVFLNDKRRALHDYMAGSVVVKLSMAEREHISTREPGDLLDPVPE